MRWYHWVLLVAVILIAFGAYLLGMRDPPKIDSEIEAIRAKADAKRWKAALGAQKAAEKVERRYLDRIEKLNDLERQEVDRLRNDPVALADMLARLSD